jgi:predicted RecB family nuclease
MVLHRITGERWLEKSEECDKEGWFDFLDHVQKIFKELSEIPVIHYSSYEKTWLRKYAARWGDQNGVAESILTQLWDILSRTIRPAICLPVPSYTLKLVEKEAGFQRSQDDFGSQWSIVQYHKYIKTHSKLEKQSISEELLRYNREDCEAMCYVLNWLKELQAQED